MLNQDDAAKYIDECPECGDPIAFCVCHEPDWDYNPFPKLEEN
jgi:hypothetical protein